MNENPVSELPAACPGCGAQRLPIKPGVLSYACGSHTTLEDQDTMSTALIESDKCLIEQMRTCLSQLVDRNLCEYDHRQEWCDLHDKPAPCPHQTAKRLIGRTCNRCGDYTGSYDIRVELCLACQEELNDAIAKDD